MNGRTGFANAACALVLVLAAPAVAQDSTDPICEPDKRATRTKELEGVTQDEQRKAAAKDDQRVLKACTHHPTYVLLTTMPNPLQTHAPEYGFSPEPTELKIQVSVKVPVFSGAVHKVFGDDSSMWFAYTQTSWWQIELESAPFRESNYEPEAFLDFPLPFHALGFDGERMRFGFSHQSNGQDGTLSRSWNRFRGEFEISRADLVIHARLWQRMGEHPATDDNPNIGDYLGWGDLALSWKPSGQQFGLKINNAFGSESHRGVEFNWVFRRGVEGEPAWMLQYYHGYGESLIDYDEKVTRFGIGLMIGDLL